MSNGTSLRVIVASIDRLGHFFLDQRPIKRMAMMAKTCKTVLMPVCNFFQGDCDPSGGNVPCLYQTYIKIIDLMDKTVG